LEACGYATLVCKATHHNDVNTFSKCYVQPDHAMLMRASMAMQMEGRKRQCERDEETKTGSTDESAPSGTGMDSKSPRKTFNKVGDFPRFSPSSYVSQKTCENATRVSSHKKEKPQRSFQNSGKKEHWVEEGKLEILELKVKIAEKKHIIMKIAAAAKDDNVRYLGNQNFKIDAKIFSDTEEDDIKEASEDEASGDDFFINFSQNPSRQREY